MDFQEVKEKLMESYNISITHFNDLVEKTKDFTNKARSWQKFSPFEKEREINSFIFTPDQLPNLGKEYWFFLLTGTKENFKDQVMISFGRNSNNTLKINNEMQLKDTSDFLGGIGEVWFYHKGLTNKLGKLGGKIAQKNNTIVFNTATYNVEFSGNFPVYKIIITDNENNLILSMSTSIPKIGDSMEFFSIEKFNFGVEVGNVYLDFTGTLSKNQFNGRAYMQKVIMSAPFVPWYWGRFVFENGSILVFFLIWVDLPGVDRILYSQGKVFIVEENNYKVFRDFEVQKIKNTDYWTLVSNNKDYSVFLLIEAYTNNTFLLRSKGEFRYNEMFAEIKEIKIRDRDLVLDNSYFGKGVGSLEDAKGFCL